MPYYFECDACGSRERIEDLFGPLWGSGDKSCTNCGQDGCKSCLESMNDGASLLCDSCALNVYDDEANG